MAAPTRTFESVRRDLTTALATCVAEKGYASTTIADVVALARVSKRTFYEHFSAKEECLMALYEHVCDRLMLIIRAAASGDQPWPQRISDGAAAYLGALETMPAFTRTMLVEVQAAGHRAFQLRQRTLQRFAGTLVDLVEGGRLTDPELQPLSQPQALAIVGGINELLLHAIDPYADTAGPDVQGRFAALHEDVVRLISAVLKG
ncbi:TetR/AcrR family transcriptional regulator [Catellatospora bangladeshensis]|uniref:TetR family transcriptional regulator n=1 Tax=Catellatospora bangladeshensis TaxID=310355 RepID=A0A8J3JTU2_9ACTN|nr:MULTISPECIES: TetR/AcrR family transcriptional regulator [Catellatospora]BCJ74028.1 TetR family transcriptional regulator [Catellatospora sp. IY07-71]GIF84903.1 TetR family transcriptional regulator [Catellatospora bangladeshensis]